MEELLQRNHRFAHGELASLRMALAAGQKPYAAVVCCADSRVSPELIFESGLGELFVVRFSSVAPTLLCSRLSPGSLMRRTAGNLVDEIALGSIEFAVEHLGVSLLLVLGHEKCGAVQAGTIN
jgi:carbonic anhydrase